MTRVWTRDDIIYAMWEWGEKHGRQPAWDDWTKSGGDEHPTSVTVHKHFGSWSDAIKEAGYEPLRPPVHKPAPFPHDEARRLRKKGIPDIEIARMLGVSSKRIKRALGPPRKPVPRKRTREQRIADLRKALSENE